jgi:hypothetical protein
VKVLDDPIGLAQPPPPASGPVVNGTMRFVVIGPSVAAGLLLLLSVLAVLVCLIKRGRGKVGPGDFSQCLSSEKYKTRKDGSFFDVCVGTDGDAKAAKANPLLHPA